MKVNAKLIVLHVSRYNFTTDAGEVLTGCKIQAVDLPARDDSSDRRGSVVYQLSAPLTAFDAFREVPGVYDVQLDMGVSKGKPVLKYASHTFVSALTPEALVTGAKVPAAKA